MLGFVTSLPWLGAGSFGSSVNCSVWQVFLFLSLKDEDSRKDRVAHKYLARQQVVLTCFNPKVFYQERYVKRGLHHKSNWKESRNSWYIYTTRKVDGK